MILFYALLLFSNKLFFVKLAHKAGVFYDKVSNVTIWGNHSTTQVEYFQNIKKSIMLVVSILNEILLGASRG